MTAKQRAKECTWDTGAPDWGSDDQERLEAAVEAAIIVAVAEERCAIAYRLGEMRGESRSSNERETYTKVMMMIDGRARSERRTNDS
jgi:hypothetical protein